MSLYCIRHGKTNYNQSGRLTGSVDVCLNAAGREEARKIIQKLPKSIKEIWCSDLIRARQTCEIINKKLHLPVKYTPDLRGRCFGSLQGKTWAQLTKLYPEEKLSQKDRQQKYNYRPYGGDSVSDVRKRIRRVCTVLQKKKHDVLIITSGGVIRLLHHKHHGLIRLKINNCTIHQFNCLK